MTTDDLRSSRYYEGLSVVVVADASESAISYWSRTTQIIQDLLYTQPRIYLLGHTTPLTDNTEILDFADFPPPQARHCSLIAPIMYDLLHRYQPVDLLIIIGSGEIWDLRDWLNLPLIGRWLLARVGPDSLQANDLTQPEYPAEQIEAVLSQLSSSPSPVRANSPPAGPQWSSAGHLWDIDRSGFPLIYVEPLNAFVHLFPVAKAQFEQFLWQHNPLQWGDDRYQELLALNPRTAPAELSESPYEGLFLTGITPDEILPFARWLGRGYGLLTVEEWQTMRRWLAQQQSSTIPPGLGDRGLAYLARSLWQSLVARIQPQTMQELALMVGGLLEWVSTSTPHGSSKEYFGMGQPRPAFFHTLKDADTPQRPISVNRRMRYFGFRLKRVR